MLPRVTSRFSVEIFCLTVPNHFVEEPFCAVFQGISGGERVYGKEGATGAYRNFPSQNAEKIRRGTFSLSLVSGIEKTYASEGYVTIFRGTSLTQSTETFRRETLLCCVSEKFWHPKCFSAIGGGGSIKIFRR